MTLTIKLSFISILLLSTVLAQQNPEFGSHGGQDFEPEIIDIEEDTFEEDRVLMGYPKLRIVVDYEHVTEGTEEFKTYVKTQLVPAVTSYFNNALKVKSPVTTPITSTAKTLCGFPTPKVLASGVKGDIFIFINTKNDTTGGWSAATTLCALSTTKKPLIVNIGINTYAFGTASIDKNPLTHDLYISTIAHEFIHALGMNGVLYKYFVDKSGNTLTDHVKTIEISGQNRTVLDLEPLTIRLRNFYGCSTLPGVIMEDDGGAHLERRYFQYEVMCTGGIQGAKISEISLAFLEGTGWYIPDYSYAEPYSFGQGQGCGFIYDSCDPNVFDDEYCDGNGVGCNQVGTSGGYCKSDYKSESCKSYISQSEFNCENPNGIYYTPFSSKQVYGRGLGSKCFSGNLTTYKPPTTVKQASYCFTFNCVGEGLNTTLEVNFGTSVVTCAQKGFLSVQGYSGFLNCPDPLTFCSTIGKPTCPRNCLGRGTCVNGKCQCNAGFQGTDCGFTI